jgi:orotidine-5'-phosphate decarboxylase
MSERLIHAQRSLIVAADVRADRFHDLVRDVSTVPEVGAIKIGFQVAFGGLKRAVYTVRDVNSIQDADIKIIYDHQKAGNDIPDTGTNFAREMADAGVDAAILFPFTGPKTQEAWTRALQEEEVGVIVGADMTHEGFRRREGGVMADGDMYEIFERAIERGVTDFVVPGNRPDSVRRYREFFDRELGEGNFDLYAPGFISQGGDISAAGEKAGRLWHAIIGRAITEAADPAAAASEYGSQLRNLIKEEG